MDFSITPIRGAGPLGNLPIGYHSTNHRWGGGGNYSHNIYSTRGDWGYNSGGPGGYYGYGRHVGFDNGYGHGGGYGCGGYGGYNRGPSWFVTGQGIKNFFNDFFGGGDNRYDNNLRPLDQSHDRDASYSSKQMSSRGGSQRRMSREQAQIAGLEMELSAAFNEADSEMHLRNNPLGLSNTELDEIAGSMDGKNRVSNRNKEGWFKYPAFNSVEASDVMLDALDTSKGDKQALKEWKQIWKDSERVPEHQRDNFLMVNMGNLYTKNTGITYDHGTTPLKAIPVEHHQGHEKYYVSNRGERADHGREEHSRNPFKWLADKFSGGDDNRPQNPTEVTDTRGPGHRFAIGPGHN